MITGAIVLRTSECRSGSRLTIESARRARTGSLPTRSRKSPDIGGLLVRDSAVKNCLVAGVISSGVSYAESFARARESAKIALSGRGIELCVDVPRAPTVNGIDDLSAVEMLT